MASNVVVIDATARRHTIKTTPQKHLSDILQEACTKFGVSADQFGLRHNDKPVDLSRTMRLSGLGPGARLTLVKVSRTPTAVSVALQLPLSVTPTPTRLTDKFASDTTLWQILRRFESGVAGGEGTTGKNYNFTQRATPLMANGSQAVAGAGRLCYEMPTFNVLGKQLDTLPDLHKTLSQLGISGSAMLRLDFRNTQQPLEEAMAEISKYFKEVEEPPATSAVAAADPMDTEEPFASEQAAMDTQPEPVASIADTHHEQVESLPSSSTEAPVTSTADPKLMVYTAPATSAPVASRDFNPEDYVPTAEHARSHQALLNRSSKNKKLLSENELATERQAKAEALAAVQNVTVRLRFPDQSLVQRACSKDDTAETLYAVCREVMDRANNERFELRSAGPGGTSVPVAEGPQRLIQDLGWIGRILVTVVWGDGVSADVKAKASLKPAYRQQAQQLKVEDTPFQPEPEGPEDQDKGKAKADDNKAKKSSGDKEARMMNRLLGKLGKK